MASERPNGAGPILLKKGNHMLSVRLPHIALLTVLVAATFLRAGFVSADETRPQTPKKPFPYDEQEVVYENKKAGVKLAGTLTLPRSGGPCPAVLLITGSGPQDRDETILRHKPFLVLADHLSRLGVAVLRVDDRGVGLSTGNFMQSTTEDFAADAAVGGEFLKGHKQIDAKRIGLIGHSEGGLIAAMIAAGSPDIAFIVLLGGPGLPGEEILYLQGGLIARAAGASQEHITLNRVAQQRLFGIIKREPDVTKARIMMKEEIAKMRAEMTEGQKQHAGNILSAMESQVGFLLMPWFRYFLMYDPRPALGNVKCPVLAVIGENDLQVPALENLTAIEQALAGGGNNQYTTLKLADLNHLFQTSRTGSPTEYGVITETISPMALKIISDWIAKNSVRR